MCYVLRLRLSWVMSSNVSNLVLNWKMAALILRGETMAYGPSSGGVVFVERKK